MNQNTSLYIGPTKIQNDWWGDSGQWQIRSKLYLNTTVTAIVEAAADLQYLYDGKTIRAKQIA